MARGGAPGGTPSTTARGVETVGLGGGAASYPPPRRATGPKVLRTTKTKNGAPPMNARPTIGPPNLKPFLAVR